MSKKDVSSEYPRKQAANLISACYNHNGADVKSKFLEKSILEGDLGELPDTWNVGLFRFLDESIYLMKFLGYFTLAKALQAQEHRSMAMLTYQIEKNLLAVRVLSAAGLDASARQNLRALFEMCQAACRCVVDREFSENFSQPATPEEANKFWHQFIAKGKTEKFLKKYNEENEFKCGLVLDEKFEDVSKILGVGAHPNFLGWGFDFKNDWQNSVLEEAQGTMFEFSSRQASELVLATASQIAFLTITFCAKQISTTHSTLGLLTENPMFKHCESDRTTIEAIGSNSALMFLMLCKMINRAKPDFDPKTHF